MKRRSFCIGWWLVTGAPLLAAITPAPLFRDGAVLQRDRPLPVWGTGAPREAVQVRFHGQTVQTVAGPDGHWRVTLQPEAASASPRELVLQGSNTVIVRDVLVGDVWLCSGQSNMEFQVKKAADAEREMAAAQDPLIRHFKIPWTPSSVPRDTCEGQWVAAAPSTVGEFTAVGYFFARDWRKATGVPVGLINSTYGGTQIESWLSAAALRADASYPAVAARWSEWRAELPERMKRYDVAMSKWRADKAEAAKTGQAFDRRAPARPEGEGTRREPSGLYQGMIHPLKPYALRGILWYQGEANGERAAEYHTLFASLIRQWRADFEQPQLPFGFAQLANFHRAVDKSDQQWAFLREAQAAALALPATGMAVTIDIGDPGDIHPKNKQEVGRRLALWARAHVLGEAVAYTGPRYIDAEPLGATLAVRLTGMENRPPDATDLTGFELAGVDRRFVPATARWEGSRWVLTAPGVSAPVAARYAWRNAPIATLFSADGLPAAPFRTDDW